MKAEKIRNKRQRERERGARQSVTVKRQMIDFILTACGSQDKIDCT
jgi:hypothetical protein